MALTVPPLQLLQRLKRLKRQVLMLLFSSALPLAVVSQFLPMSHAINEPLGRGAFGFVTLLGSALTLLLWRWPGVTQSSFFNTVFMLSGNIMVGGAVIGEMLLFRSNTSLTLMLWPMVAVSAFQSRTLLIWQTVLGTASLFLLAYLKQALLNPGWLWMMDGLVMTLAVTVTGLTIAYFRDTAVHEATELARVVNLDPLTGLPNRRQLEVQFDELTARMGGSERVAVIMLDLDDFKTINDRFGHQVGDEVIIAFAQALQEHARPRDLIARMGGEEFLWITTTSQADFPHLHDLLRRVNDLRTQFSRAAHTHNVTVSAGVSCRPPEALTSPAASLSGLMRQADQALYQAKEQGRNRVCLAPTT